MPPESRVPSRAAACVRAHMAQGPELRLLVHVNRTGCSVGAGACMGGGSKPGVRCES